MKRLALAVHDLVPASPAKAVVREMAASLVAPQNAPVPVGMAVGSDRPRLGCLSLI
jgi:hypothetical protein